MHTGQAKAPAATSLIRVLVRLTVIEAIMIALIVAVAAVLITAMSLCIAGIVNAPAETPIPISVVAEEKAPATDDPAAQPTEPPPTPTEPAPDKPDQDTYIVVHMDPPE